MTFKLHVFHDTRLFSSLMWEIKNSPISSKLDQCNITTIKVLLK